MKALTVGELIARLKQFPEDAPVWTYAEWNQSIENGVVNVYPFVGKVFLQGIENPASSEEEVFVEQKSSPIATT